jgi:hypothetical protein
MNRLNILATATLVCAATTAFGQAPATTNSKLAGFHTVTALASSTTLVGVNYVRPVLASGIIDAKAANSLTDNDVDFLTALAGQTNLWIEMTSGTNKGIATSLSSVGLNALATEDDLSSLVEVGDTYVVRTANTVATLFGATNQAGLRGSNSPNSEGGADLVHIPDGNGGFRIVYYSSKKNGWREVGNATADASGIPVYHVDAIQVQRNQASNLALRFAGVLKVTPTYFFATTGVKTDVNTNYPTGSTLTNSGLKDYVQHGSETTGDLIWFQDGSTGVWNQYYYTDAAAPLTEGWKQVGQGDADKGSTAFPSAFSIERRGASGLLKLAPPPEYEGL